MSQVPPVRRLSVGMVIYKRVFPVFLIIAGVVSLGIGLWNPHGDNNPVLSMLPLTFVIVVTFVITKVIGSELADEVLDGGDHLVIRKDGREGARTVRSSGNFRSCEFHNRATDEESPYLRADRAR